MSLLLLLVFVNSILAVSVSGLEPNSRMHKVVRRTSKTESANLLSVLKEKLALQGVIQPTSPPSTGNARPMSPSDAIGASSSADDAGAKPKRSRSRMVVIKQGEDGRFYEANADSPDKWTRVRSGNSGWWEFGSKVRHVKWKIGGTVAQYKIRPGRKAGEVQAAEPEVRKGPVLLMKDSNLQYFKADGETPDVWKPAVSGARRNWSLGSLLGRGKSVSGSAVSKIHRRAIESRPDPSDAAEASSPGQDSEAKVEGSRPEGTSLSQVSQDQFFHQNGQGPAITSEAPAAHQRVVRFTEPAEIVEKKAKAGSASKLKPEQSNTAGASSSVAESGSGDATGATSEIQPEPEESTGAPPERELPAPRREELGRIGTEFRQTIQYPSVKRPSSLQKAALRTSYNRFKTTLLSKTAQINLKSLSKFLPNLRRPKASSSTSTAPESGEFKGWVDSSGAEGSKPHGLFLKPGTNDEHVWMGEHGHSFGWEPINSGPLQRGSGDAKGKSVVDEGVGESDRASSEIRPESGDATGASTSAAGEGSSDHAGEPGKTPSGSSVGSFESAPMDEVGSEPGSPGRPTDALPPHTGQSSSPVDRKPRTTLQELLKQPALENAEKEKKAAEVASHGERPELTPQEALDRAAKENAAYASSQGRLLVSPESQHLVDHATEPSPSSVTQTGVDAADGIQQPLSRHPVFPKPAPMSPLQKARWKLSTFADDIRDIHAVGRDRSLMDYHTTGGVPAIYGWRDRTGEPVMPTEARRIAQTKGEVRVFYNPFDPLDQKRFTYTGTLRQPGEALLPHTDPGFHAYDVTQRTAKPLPRHWRDAGLSEEERSDRAGRRQFSSADGQWSAEDETQRWPVKWDKTKAELAGKVKSLREGVVAAPGRVRAWGQSLPQQLTDTSTRVRNWYAARQASRSAQDARPGRFTMWRDTARQAWARTPFARTRTTSVPPTEAQGEAENVVDTTPPVGNVAQEGQPPRFARFRTALSRMFNLRPGAASAAQGAQGEAGTRSWRQPFQSAVNGLRRVRDRATTLFKPTSTTRTITEHADQALRLHRRRLHRRRLHRRRL